MGKFGNFLNTQTGGKLTGGLLDGIGSLFTIGAQKRAATTAFKRQKELFDYQNAYNTPAKQMQRLKEAGLNPALMYGQGNTGNATGFAGVAKADVTGPSLAQSAATGAQMSLLNSQKALQDSQATLNAIEGGVKTGQLKVSQDLAASSIELNAQKVKESMAQVGNIEQQTELAIQTINHQASTGMIKGDIMGNLAKALNINVDTKEGRQDAQLKVAGLILGKKILDLAPQIIEMIGKRLGGKFSGDDIADALRRNVYNNKEKNQIIDTIIDLWQNKK